MIENAPLSDTRVQNYAAKVGDRLVGPIFGLALMTYLLGGRLLPRRRGAHPGLRVRHPCLRADDDLELDGRSSQGGAVHQGGKALEKLAEVDAVVFDKTGTLTAGRGRLGGAHAGRRAGLRRGARLAASVEANLAHPAAKAIVDAAEARGLSIPPSAQMELSPGLGVKAVVESRTVIVGSERYLHQQKVDTAAAAGSYRRVPRGGQLSDIRRGGRQADRAAGILRSPSARKCRRGSRSRGSRGEANRHDDR